MILQEASKRPFRHPVPAEAVPYFCHPRPGHGYHEPAWGRDARLYASNGWVAVRFFNFPPDMAPGPQTVVDRLRKLSWHSERYEVAKAWRKLDDCTLDLFRDGVLPPWEVEVEVEDEDEEEEEEEEEEVKVIYRHLPFVRINHRLLVPAASLQLISRLPACGIYTGASRGAPVAFRFRGGEGLLACLSHDQEMAAVAEAGNELCHLFAT